MLKRAEDGWTMVELIFTLSLLGLLATLSLPAFSQLGERVEREMFLHFLAIDLQYAQMEAMSREEEVIVHIASNSRWIIITQADKHVRKTEIPQRYQLKHNYPDGKIIFRRTGQVRGGTIKLLTGNRVCGLIKIQVASGRPRVVMEP